MTDVPDLEVGRLALRTFKIEDHRLKSLYKEHYWDDGRAVATCSYDVAHGHQLVDKECTCGLYGTLTIEQLFREYGGRAHRCVAVIAAEGATVIGPKGLRTAAARIIAYWAMTGGCGALAAFQAQCPEAKHYQCLSEMLTAHGFDAVSVDEGMVAWSGLLPVAPRQHQGWGQNQAFYSASGGYASGGPARIRLSASVRTGGSGFTSLSPNGQTSWDNIVGLLPAVTSAGAAAIRHALGLPTTKDTT